jgi:predicted DNA-binding ribbon-helix-helix protein
MDGLRKSVSITVSPQAHHLLRAIAEHDRVTISQVIEKYLEARYREAVRDG